MPISIICFDGGGKVTNVEDYNLNKIEPNWWALKGLAASPLPAIQEFYKHEENVCAFEEWLQKREKTAKTH